MRKRLRGGQPSKQKEIMRLRMECFNDGWVSSASKGSDWVSIDIITLLISLTPCSSSTRLLSIGTSKRSSHAKSTVIHSAHMSNRSLSVSWYDMAAAKQKALALLHFPGALFWYLDSMVS